MKAYICDLCLKYCDDVYSYVDLLFKPESREIKELCESCFMKLNKWIDENAERKDESESE